MGKVIFKFSEDFKSCTATPAPDDNASDKLKMLYDVASASSSNDFGFLSPSHGLTDRVVVNYALAVALHKQAKHKTSADSFSITVGDAPSSNVDLFPLSTDTSRANKDKTQLAAEDLPSLRQLVGATAFVTKWDITPVPLVKLRVSISRFFSDRWLQFTNFLGFNKLTPLERLQRRAVNFVADSMLELDSKALEAIRSCYTGAGKNAAYLPMKLQGVPSWLAIISAIGSVYRGSDDQDADFLAIVAAKKHADSVVDSLVVAQQFGLLSNDAQGRANAAAIGAAQEHAESVAYALSLAQGYGLLSNDAQGRANRAAIGAAKEHAKNVQFALLLAINAGLLTLSLSLSYDEQGQRNFAAIADNAQYAELLAHALVIVSLIINDSNRQAVFNSICEKLANAALAEKFKGLLAKLAYYPRLFTMDLWRQTLNLAQADVGAVANAIEVLVADQMMTREAYTQLLQEPSKAFMIATLLAGRVATFEELSTSITGIASLTRFAPIMQQWSAEKQRQVFLLYQRFCQTSPSLMSIATISGLLQLSDNDLTWLENTVTSTKDHPFGIIPIASEARYSVNAHILAERYAMTCQYAALSRQNLSGSMPAPLDYESSMRSDLVRLTRERLAALKQNAPLSDEELARVEERIRRTLLDALEEEFKSQDKTSPAAEQSAQVVYFITTNREALATRAASAEVVAQAVEYFKEKNSVAQTAWRAYEPTAPIYKTEGGFEWPNLLVEPTTGADNTVFTTPEARGDLETITLKSTSDEVRRLAAKCFLVIEQSENPSLKQQMTNDFIVYLAEIRRAHNTSATIGIDDPSCYPGVLSRIGRSLDKHPKFASNAAPTPVDGTKIIEQTVTKLAQQAVDAMAAKYQGRPIDQRALLSAINLYGNANDDELLRHPGAIGLNLSYTDDDVAELSGAARSTATAAAGGVSRSATGIQEERVAIVERAKEQRRLLMREITGDNGAKCYDSVDAELRQVGCVVAPEKIAYLISKHLAVLPRLVSIPGPLLQAAQYEAVKNEATASHDSKNTPTKSLLDKFSEDLRAALKDNSLTLNSASPEGTKEEKKALAEALARLDSGLGNLEQQNGQPSPNEIIVQRGTNMVCNATAVLLPHQESSNLFTTIIGILIKLFPNLRSRLDKRAESAPPAHQSTPTTAVQSVVEVARGNVLSPDPDYTRDSSAEQSQPAAASRASRTSPSRRN